MKKKGTKSEHEEERNNDLMRVYHELIKNAKEVNLSKIYEQIVNMPSRRFWISEERAAIVLSAMMKGDNLKGMRPTKREMFQELYRRALAIKKKQPNIKPFRLALMVVNQPAPKFYMEPGYARLIITSFKKKWFEERRKKLRFLF